MRYYVERRDDQFFHRARALVINVSVYSGVSELVGVVYKC